jgi:adducin
MAPPSPDEVETPSAPANGVETNGDSKYIDSVDQDDPQYIKDMQRPPDIKEDLQAMEARQRVSVILNSQAFREELEAIVESQIRNSSHPASLIALQHIAEMVLPPSCGKAFRKGSVAAGLGPGLQTTIPLAAAASLIPPVNDLRGSDFMAYSKVEKYLRCKLASLYRIVDLFGWSHGIYNHITVRAGTEADHFLINPFGMLYSEITASSLVKVDTLGSVVDEGSTTMGINKAGYTIHSALHSFRPDIKCIIHLHTPAAVAVSACKQGLMAISQEAMIVGDVSYHDYHGIALTDEEKDALQKSIGPYNKVVFLRNHGILACGGTIEEAWHFAFNTMKACETQVKLIPLGLENVIEASPEAREQVKEVTSHGGGGVDSSGKKWKIGELEFEALMRLLDNAGYQTGYIYKQPMNYDIKVSRAGSEVEIPPSATNIPAYGPDSELSPSKQMALLKQKKFKDSWLNSPNAYSKIELEETGTMQPKKYTTVREAFTFIAA